MGTNSAPLVADLFLFCYVRDFTKDLSNDKHADIIKAFNKTSRYLDDLLNIDKVANHVASMIGFTDLQDQCSDITGEENRLYLS